MSRLNQKPQKKPSVALKEDVWLSQFLAPKQVWQVTDAAQLEDIPAQSFLYAKVPVDDVAAAKVLQQKGFYLVDTNLRFEQQTPLTGIIGPACRTATEQDRTQVKKIAANALIQTRFHLDPAISNETAAAIKAAWVENYFNGQRGDDLIVAVQDDQVLGFVLLIKQDNGAVIDLIAVDPTAQRRQVGAALVQAANQAYGLLTAGTQAANQKSIQFYQKYGFTLAQSTYVFHCHTK